MFNELILHQIHPRRASVLILVCATAALWKHFPRKTDEIAKTYVRLNEALSLSPDHQ